MLQGSPEYIEARLGKLGASQVADAIARTKTGWGASRANVMASIIAERLSGAPTNSYTSPEMQRGKDVEPQARAYYEFMTGKGVDLAGWLDHPFIKMAGCSPDGLVGDSGLVEFKNPNTATHIDTLLGKTIPGHYITQVQWQMATTGRLWCDWVSFDDRLPPDMAMHVVRVVRDQPRIEELEALVAEFLKETDGKLRELTKRYAPPLNILAAG